MPPGPLAYKGQLVVSYIQRPFPPTTAFNDFDVPTIWVDPLHQEAYILVAKPQGVAEWILIGGTPGVLATLTGNTGGPITPMAGNINIVGDGTSIVFAGNNSTATLTASVSGSVATTYTGNSGTATPSANNLNVVTSNASVKFVGSGSTLTQNFGVSNLILGSNYTGSGGENVGIGTNCLPALTTGVSNCCHGAFSGFSLTTGANNIAIGTSSLFLLTSGIQNVALGGGTLDNLLTGSYNIAIGSAANTISGVSYTSSESSNIVIGNAGVTGESNTIRIGTQGSGNAEQNTCYVAGVAGVATTNSQVVTVNTATGQLGSTPMASSGAWVKIQTQTAANSPTLDFTTGISATYTSYVFILSDVLPTAFNVQLEALISTNGGTSYLTSGYQSGQLAASYNSNVWANNNGTTAIFVSGGNVNTSGSGVSGNVNFYNITTASPPACLGLLYWNNGTTNLNQIVASNTTTAGVNAFRWLFGSGNIASGTISLYGILP